MSEHSITIVPRKSVYPDNENKAKEILEWLVSRDIVKAELSDCVVSAQNAYAISEGAEHVIVESINLPYHYLNADGLQIITNRQVFDTGENGIEKLICPNCNRIFRQKTGPF
ncbi:hypothetical protein BH11BAC5_BH11BAC5_26310 [soil metagenome]